jgi:hypothetical protein
MTCISTYEHDNSKCRVIRSLIKITLSQHNKSSNTDWYNDYFWKLRDKYMHNYGLNTNITFTYGNAHLKHRFLSTQSGTGCCAWRNLKTKINSWYFVVIAPYIAYLYLIFVSRLLHLPSIRRYPCSVFDSAEEFLRKLLGHILHKTL